MNVRRYLGMISVMVNMFFMVIFVLAFTKFVDGNISGMYFHTGDWIAIKVSSVDIKYVDEVISHEIGHLIFQKHLKNNERIRYAKLKAEDYSYDQHKKISELFANDYECYVDKSCYNGRDIDGFFSEIITGIMIDGD